MTLDGETRSYHKPRDIGFTQIIVIGLPPYHCLFTGSDKELAITQQDISLVRSLEKLPWISSFPGNDLIHD